MLKDNVDVLFSHRRKGQADDFTLLTQSRHQSGRGMSAIGLERAYESDLPVKTWSACGAVHDGCVKQLWIAF